VRILVRAPHTTSEHFLAYPFFVVLRERFPTAKITVVCPAHLKGLQFMACVDEVLTLPWIKDEGSKWQRFRALLKSAAEVGKDHYDLGFVLPSSLSAAVWMKRVGVRRRVGWAGEGRQFFLSQAVSSSLLDSRHRGDHYLKLLSAALRREESQVPEAESFWSALPENPLDPRVAGWRERFWADHEWPSRSQKKHNSIPDVTVPFMIMAPWGESETTAWPILFYRDLLRRILDQTSYSVVVIGSAADIAQSRELLAGWDTSRVVDALARAPLNEYASLFERADLVISSDSPWAHLSALCSPATQLIWGGADPSRVRPLGPGRVQLAVQPVECWPCDRRVCLQSGSKKLSCLKEVSVDTVWEEIQRGLEYVVTRNASVS
jgi:ADP-heptose:LPS heptosyltransferase